MSQILPPTGPNNQDTIAYARESAPMPTSSSRVSPGILLAIVILAAVFFACGLVHLLIRFLMKKPSSSIYQSERFAESSGSHVLQRQLQQLFHLHDSGLDQAFIDMLPVFNYRDILGVREPFDCAVCLCEFSEQDTLRLLPVPACSHAFHINCIDTWLLSNSTCPLCRGTLASSGLFGEEAQVSCNDNSWAPLDMISGDARDALQSVRKRVFSVRLGKFRSLNKVVVVEPESGVETGEQEGSSRNLDPRRCYSMGSYQYVVGDLDLRVALSPKQDPGRVEFDSRFCRMNRACLDARDEEGKKINGRCRRESFSVSKIWLWSNSKDSIGFPDSPSDVHPHQYA